MNPKIFKEDTSEDTALGLRRSNSRKSIKNRGHPKVGVNHKRTKVKDKNLPVRLRKALSYLDSHHVNFALNIIYENALFNAPTTKKLSKVNPICRNCIYCVRAVQFCALKTISCKDINVCGHRKILTDNND